MSQIFNLGYVVLGVSDFDAWEVFARDLIGFQIGRREDNVMTLRMDEYEQRIVLEKGDDDDLRGPGWEFQTRDDLEAFVSALKEKNIDVRTEDEALTRSRRVEVLYSIEDFSGLYRHEFYFGPSILGTVSPFRSSVLTGSGFVTGDLGVGHILPRSIDYEAQVKFYQDVIGLRISDYIRHEVAPGVVVDATFMHTRTGRHHSLATGKFPGPKIMSHMMVEVPEINDVGLAFERCVNAGCTITADIGRHPNDQMISFYVTTPSGFNFECGYGGVVVDDENWKIVSYGHKSDWGHKRLPDPKRS